MYRVSSSFAQVYTNRIITECQGRSCGLYSVVHHQQTFTPVDDPFLTQVASVTTARPMREETSTSKANWTRIPIRILTAEGHASTGLTALQVYVFGPATRRRFPNCAGLRGAPRGIQQERVGGFRPKVRSIPRRVSRGTKVYENG